MGQWACGGRKCISQGKHTCDICGGLYYKLIHIFKGGTIPMQEVKFTARDGKQLFCTLWDDVKNPVAVVQIIHGMDEHVGRYDRFAKFLNKNGYIVFGDDHRAHGRTASDISKIGQPDGDSDLFLSTVNDEIAISKYLKKKYKIPVLIFGHSYGSFITQRIMEEPDLIAAGVCLAGTAKYPATLIIPGLIAAFVGKKLFGPDAPARFIEYFSPIRNKTGGVSKLTRDNKQAKIHDSDPMRARYFSYGFYYSLFKNLLMLSGYTNVNLPILIISGSRDLVSMNSRFATSLYRMYKTANVKNVNIIIYPGARHELLMETNFAQVQRDILKFFNSVVRKGQKKPTE